MNPIDLQLYRPLKAGKEYAALIPAYKGINYGFDKKKDNSNTYDTLRFMAQWSNKYAGQMSKVALKLKGRSLQETVNNIYDFLYNHFQYKIDGETQNLYSPSAAWYFRESGFDCKTYSILASTILQNLQIPHAFRMVKQGGIRPNDFTHVYVVVPFGKSHYVIDATTHSNKEVSFTEKYDYNMEHRGLASPFIKFSGLGCGACQGNAVAKSNGLGCGGCQGNTAAKVNGLGCGGCQGKPIAQSGLNSPIVFSKTVQNFHKFLNELEKNGVSRQVTNRMLDLVKINVQNGIDPNMGDILRKSFADVPLQGINSPAYNTSYGNGNYYSIGLNGIDIGNTATAAATGDVAGVAVNVLKGVFDMDATFGAVFANGFDLSCWNSSYSEQKATKDLEALLPFILEWSGAYSSPSQENLDKFLWLCQSAINDSIHGQESKYAKCSRKGHALRQKGIETLRDNVLEELKRKKFVLTPIGKKSGATWKTTIPGRSEYNGWANEKVQWDSYSITKPQSPAPAPAATADGSKENTNTDGKTTTETSSKTSTGTLVAIGSAILLGAKLLL